MLATQHLDNEQFSKSTALGTRCALPSVSSQQEAMMLNNTATTPMLRHVTIALLAVAASGASLFVGTGQAHAEPARQAIVRQAIVRLADLDLATTAGQGVLQARISRAARQVCAADSRDARMALAARATLPMLAAAGRASVPPIGLQSRENHS
jgi:UrcA family protein